MARKFYTFFNLQKLAVCLGCLFCSLTITLAQSTEPEVPFSISNGQALSFDGVDDHVNFSGVEIVRVTDYTIEHWFKLDEYPEQRKSLFDMGVDWNIRQRISVDNFTFEYAISVWNGSGVTFSSITAPELPTLNEWHHVAVSYDDSTKIGTMYLDGAAVGSDTMLVKPEDFLEYFFGQNLNYIGRSLDFENNQYLKMQVDDFRYWTTTRSAEEIADNRFCRQDDMTNLLIYAPFEEGTAGGDNTGIAQTANFSDRFEQFFGEEFDDGNLFNFALADTTSNFVAVNGIAPCEKCEIRFADVTFTTSCPNDPSGTITLTGLCPGCANDPAQLEYSIDGTTYQTDTTFGNLVVGDYTVFVRGANNPECVAKRDITIFNGNSAPTVSTQDVTLNADADGIITVTVEDVDNGSSDDCYSVDELTFTLSQTSFNCDSLGNLTPCVNVSTIAGNPNASGDQDGLDTMALFNSPRDVAEDSNGNLFVTDSRNHTIRKISPDGEVSTFAGTKGVRGFIDSTGTDAQFNSPNGIIIDEMDNLYVVDRSNSAIRRITPEGLVTTFANDVGFASGLARDTAGNIYLATFQTVQKITPDGVVSLLAGNPDERGSDDGVGTAARFNFAADVTVDGQGNIYVADASNANIRKISPNGVVTTIAGMAEISGIQDGIGTETLFGFPTGIAIDSNGIIYVADQSNSLIRRITPDGVVTTMVGNTDRGSEDGSGSVATLRPYRISLGRDGTLLIADLNNTIRKVTLIEDCASIRMQVTDGDDQSAFRLANVILNCEIISSLDEGLVNSTLEIFPNPVISQFNLSFALEQSRSLDLYLMNANGQIVHVFQQNRAFAAGNYRLPLTLPASLAAGNYFVTLVQDNQPIALKLLKL